MTSGNQTPIRQYANAGRMRNLRANRAISNYFDQSKQSDKRATTSNYRTLT